jgi:molybdate transport system ATP-binding protein
VSLVVEFSLRRPAFTLDVALEVPDGQVVALLGPNGAGKSTLLGVLAGLLRPDSGRVSLGGRTLTDTAFALHTPAHRRRVGLLAQQPLLFPHLDVTANVAFAPRCAGVSRAKARELARSWLAEVDAAALADRRPGQLSGGQAQRVALARALAGEPELMLLDEPLSALDVDVAPAMRALLRRVLRGAGRRPALLVTHHVLDAVVLADRVLVLAEGAIVEDGPAREVLTRPRSPFAARLAGLNLVSGSFGPDGLVTGDGTTVFGRTTPGLDGVGMDGPGVGGAGSGGGRAGGAAVAVFPPSAVSVFRERPEGSPRNVFPVSLAALEPHAEVVRMRAAPRPGGPAWVDGLAADVTPAAVADLGAEPGLPLWFAVKATEVAVHPASR